MTHYLMYCTVRNNNYVRMENWTKHLFQEYHQKRARLASGKWEETQKNCALIGFFSCSVSNDDNYGEGGSDLLVSLWNYLKRIVEQGNHGVCEGGSSSSLLVTDFIWQRESPTKAIIQFESRETANQVYSAIMKVGGAIGAPVKVGHFFVQFKRLVDSSKNVIRAPQSSPPPPKPSTSAASRELLPIKKRKRSSSSSSTCGSDDSLNDSSENDEKSTYIPIPSTSKSTLVTQFNSLVKSMEIPSSEIHQAAKILEQVKALISSEYPSCQVYLFRHTFLKIRNPFSYDLLVFAHGGHIPTNPGYQKLDINRVAKWAVVKAPTLAYVYEQEPKYKDSQLFELVSSSGPRCQFWICTDQAYLLEVQLNRLLEYMLTFDPKCNLLLSCLHHFCTVNSCYFSDSPSKSEAMEWLLLFFLSKEKVIPTVRQILDQPHQPIMLPNSERNIDIGFNPDPDFANKWKMARGTHKTKEITEEYVCDVLRLFQRFLRLLGKSLPGGKFILNTRDAELLNWKQVLFHPRGMWTTKLPLEEIEIIKSSPTHARKSNKWPFSIVHPLVVHLDLGYNLERFRVASQIMKRGVFHLNRFLNLRNSQYLDRWAKRRKGRLPEFYKDLEITLKIKDVPKKKKKKKKKGKNRGQKKMSKNRGQKKIKNEGEIVKREIKREVL